MAAPTTVPEFVEVVRKSGLVPDEKLNAEMARLNGDVAPPASGEQLAQAFIRAGLVSKFQARQLKLGRYKRFMVAGKYRLLELLGAGGMGAVYLCEHVLMRRLVALKVLPQEKLTDPSNLERFFREARAVAALNHPNIVRAYDIDQFEKMHFLVMEFVDGRSLQEIVALHGKMDPTRAAHYIAQAAVGLQSGHELSMVHRDIKPGNLLLERTGVIKLLDIGLARFFDDKTDNLTAKYDDKCVLGTADYLAPEQAMSNVVDTRADIYALGGTLYFMLTGVSPAPDGTVAQKLVFHQTREPKAVEHFRDDVPPELLAILRKMMAKRPADRYQTPADVADALAHWAEQLLPPPPAHEMPELCPLVLALAGHAGEKAKTAAAGRAVGRAAAVRAGAKSGRIPGGPDSGDGSGAASSRVGISSAVGQAQIATAQSFPTSPAIPSARQQAPSSGGSGGQVSFPHAAGAMTADSAPIPRPAPVPAPHAAPARSPVLVGVVAGAVLVGVAAAAAAVTYFLK